MRKDKRFDYSMESPDYRCYNTYMIIGVDIGGTKTYLACFAQNGKLLKEIRFETNRNYQEFLADLTKHAKTIETSKAKVACAAIPGLLDRRRGVVLSLGNLPWKDQYIKHDLAEALRLEKIFIENDSKLAGLAEARYVSESYKRVLYITISTGIGGALVINGKLAQEVIDAEIGKMPLVHEGKVVDWEDFASGRAFFDKYQQKAVDVTDESIWKEFSQYLNQGIGAVCATFQPEVIIFGGGMGQHLNRFEKFITPYLKTNLHSIVRQPKALLSTHYRGQSVIYGCYEYAKDHIN